MSYDEFNQAERGPEPTLDEIPLDELADLLANMDEDDRAVSQIRANIASASSAAVSLSGDELARARRETEIELAHVLEDINGRLAFLVQSKPDRAWPGKNEEARAISKSAARAEDAICKKLDARRRQLEALSAAYRGEIEAREELESQRRAAQKDLELALQKSEQDIRKRFADLDAQLRTAELMIANRGVTVADLEREQGARIAFIAKYLREA